MRRDLLFPVFITFLFLVLLEITALLLEARVVRTADETAHRPGWQTEFFAQFFDWDEPDPDLLWRFKARLDNPLIKTNSDHLIGDEIPREKDPRTYRLLLLGDSSPVGLGLQSHSLAFGELLESLLEREYADRKRFELINAAVSGYTSEQIARFLELRGWDFKPDLVILYCGNNDASISGSYSDRQLLGQQKLRKVRRLFSHLALYRVLRALLVQDRWSGTRPAETLQVRVPASRFGTNLTRIADQCRQHGCPLIVLKPPVPYLWPAGLQFKLFTQVSGEDGRLIIPDAMQRILGRPIKYCLSPERFTALYGRGDIFTRSVYRSAYSDSLPPQEAIAYYANLIATDSGNPVLFNNLGVLLWEDRRYWEADYYLKTARNLYLRHYRDSLNPTVESAGAPFLYNIGINLLSLENYGPNLLHDTARAAFQYLDSALQADYFSLRVKRTYWEKIDRLKGEKNLIVIDLPATFQAEGGEKLFIDHCHPTAEGHRLIAEEILKVIRNLLSRQPTT